MLVDLSSINYPKSGCQSIHYSRKSVDPACGEQTTTAVVHLVSIFYLQRGGGVAGWSLGSCPKTNPRLVAQVNQSNLYLPLGITGGGEAGFWIIPRVARARQ